MMQLSVSLAVQDFLNKKVVRKELIVWLNKLVQQVFNNIGEIKWLEPNDIVQEVLDKLWKLKAKDPHLAAKCSLYAEGQTRKWLRKITINLVIEKKRQEKNPEWLAKLSHSLDEEQALRQNCPINMTLTKLDQEYLVQKLAMLPAFKRQLLLSWYIQKCNQQEICKRMGIGYNPVWVSRQIKQAVKHLALIM